MSNTKKVSASQLAKQAGLPNREVVGALMDVGAIARESDDDILSLDDVMPRKLLKFGIKAD